MIKDAFVSDDFAASLGPLIPGFAVRLVAVDT